MRNLGEQWVEEIDGKKHMLKAVNYSEGCNGCIFLRYDPDEFYTCNRGRLGCPVDDGMIIKDLGILNEDECLPCPFCGEYPVVENAYEGFGYTPPDGYWRVYCSDDNHEISISSGKRMQESIDAWNRRA